MLCESEAGLKIGEYSFTAPTQADDLLLNLLTKSGLQKLMNICHQYSLKWRFFYKNSKCLVIIYIDKPLRAGNPSSSWTFGGGEILQTAHHKHLGVVQTQSLRQPGDISAVLRTLKGHILVTSNLWTSRVRDKSHLSYEVIHFNCSAKGDIFTWAME